MYSKPVQEAKQADRNAAFFIYFTDVVLYDALYLLKA